MPNHVLMTVLGTLGPNSKKPKYRLEDKPYTYTASLAPVALYHLLRHEDRPLTKILAFCTDRARSETYPLLKEQLAQECEVRAVTIPAGDQRDDIGKFLNTFAREAPREGLLTIETTHGFRHYAILMLLGAFYVDALRESLELQNIYYALLQDNNKTALYIDLGELLDFFKWIYAANTFRDTGSAHPMSELIQKSAGWDQTRDTVRNLENLSRSLADALPVELGLETRYFLDRLPRQLNKLIQGTLRSAALSGELRDLVKNTLGPYAVATETGQKKDVPLNEMELERQARIIERLYMKYDSHAAAFGLMREWTVSWAVLCLQADGKDWLDRKKMRPKAERALGLLGELARLQDEGHSQIRLSNDQYRLACFWTKHLGPTRNQAHHHGMRTANALEKDFRKSADEAWRYWSETLRALPAISLETISGAYRRLIVSPLGNTPGVLFSTIGCLGAVSSEKDICLVITSEQARVNMHKALDLAGFAGRREILQFRNPFSGLQEREKLLEKATEYILATGETHVNLTGGTSLMGLLAEEIANRAREFQRLASRFVLIDERPYEEQLDKPYVKGSMRVVEPASKVLQ